MSENERNEPEAEQRAEDVEDLDVPAEQQEDVAGGWSWGKKEPTHEE